MAAGGRTFTVHQAPTRRSRAGAAAQARRAPLPFVARWGLRSRRAGLNGLEDNPRGPSPTPVPEAGTPGKPAIAVKGGNELCAP
jgi:hypothetical protein